MGRGGSRLTERLKEKYTERGWSYTEKAEGSYTEIRGRGSRLTERLEERYTERGWSYTESAEGSYTEIRGIKNN